MSEVRAEWEQTDSGWLVVEHGGMLKTGPFVSKEAARRWFAEELDKTIPEEASDGQPRISSPRQR